MHRPRNYHELVKGNWSSVKNQSHHRSQAPRGDRVTPSTCHLLTSTVWWRATCFAPQSSLTTTCSTASPGRSISYITGIGAYPVLPKPHTSFTGNHKGQAPKWQTETNVLPEQVKLPAKATVGRVWTLHTSFIASWPPPCLQSHWNIPYKREHTTWERVTIIKATKQGWFLLIASGQTRCFGFPISSIQNTQFVRLGFRIMLPIPHTCFSLNLSYNPKWSVRL